MDFDQNRRTFLKVLGGAGLATLAGCGGDAPVKRLLSPLEPVENLVPGVPSWYASVCRECPAGCGVVVATLDGRPIKVEGNPLHPINRGSLCARGQAALQGLYHPNRVRVPLRRGSQGEKIPVSWEEAFNSLAGLLRGRVGSGAPGGVALITPPLPGSLGELVRIWAEEFPELERYEYEGISYEPLLEAGEITFGRRVLPHFRIEDSDLLVSFGADFLETWISPVRYSAEFARMRTYHEGSIGRMIYVGSRQGLTAANADETIHIRPGTTGALAMGIGRLLLLEETLRPLPDIPDLSAWRDRVQPYDPATVERLTDVPGDRVRHLARILARSRNPLVLPGGIEQNGSNATRNAVAVYFLNFLLGAFPERMEIPIRQPRSAVRSQKDFSLLLERMRRGKVKFALFAGVNPAHSLPPAAGFEEALGGVEHVACCSDISNETTALADWVLPVHHPMEAWGDDIGEGDSYGLMQPAVRPLADSKSLGEILIEIARAVHGDESPLSRFPTFYDFLVRSWAKVAEKQAPEVPFEEFWEEVRRRGGLFRQAQAGRAVLTLKPSELVFEEPELEDPPPPAQDDGPKGERGTNPTLILYPSLLLYDGRGADRPWLQEVADPVLQRTWGSSVEVSRDMAEEMALRSGDVLRVTSSHGSLEAPVFISDNDHRNTVSIALGQGRRNVGAGEEENGVNPLLLLPWSFDERSGGFSFLRVRVRLEKTGRWEHVPSPQGHPFDEGRGIAQEIRLSDLRDDGGGHAGGEGSSKQHEFKDLLKPHEHPRHRWGMVIDLNSCIGCSACTVACYAENNIPVVGRKQYGLGREMAWIRVQRSYRRGGGGGANFVPMLCQQCDNAPCEPVCPVFATYHTPEGLNAQIYNRCVGTRYCANNCPYSVRRFNWFTYSFPPPLNQQLNPRVTVRTKGVMEKCTFCIQRIMSAKGRARDENREIRDGEFAPACAQTCPTRAITFGDLKNPDSAVSRRSRDSRGYKVLEHLNTKPAVTYLKKISTGEDIV